MDADQLVARLVALAESAQTADAEALVDTHLHPDSANQVIDGLKMAADRHWDITPVVSVRLGQLVQYAAAVLSALYRAYGQMMEADGLRFQGYSAEALPLFDAAAATYTRYQRPVLWARTRIGYITACWALGRLTEALEVAETARAIFVEHGEWLRAGSVDLNTANVLDRAGNIHDALAMTDRALDIFAKITPPDEARIAHTLLNKAILVGKLGDLDTATHLFAQTKEIFTRLELPGALAQVEWDIGEVELARTDYVAALQSFQNAYTGMIAAGRIEYAAYANRSVVECLLALNRPADAAPIAAAMIADLERLGAQGPLGTALVVQAQVQARTGQDRLALLTLGQARRVFDSLGTGRRVALTDVHTTALLLKSGQIERAAEAVKRAQLSARAQDWQTLVAEADLLAAQVALAQGDPTQAAGLARQVERNAQTEGSREQAYRAMHILARATAAQGDTAAAYRWYDATLDCLDNIQVRLPMEARLTFLDDDRLDAYHDALRHSLAHNDASRAFGIAERTRSRALLDYLTHNLDLGFGGQDAETNALADELRRVQTEYAWFARKAANPPDEGNSIDVIAECRRRETQISALLARLQLRGLVGQPTRATEAVAPPHAAIPSGALMLAYVFDGDDLIIFSVASDTISATRVTEARAGLERMAMALDAHMSRVRIAGATPASIVQTQIVLRRLYDVLVAPVAPQLPRYDHLIIVPTQMLHGIPFSALYDGRAYLMESWSISTLPAAGLLPHVTAPQRTETEMKALVLGFAPGASLPFVAAEAQQVADLLDVAPYLAENAQRHVLYNEARHCRVIHLAAHGEFRPDAPLFSALHLADGPVTTLDVFQLRLDADLVTLSACNTGRNVVGRADELTGLTRAFLYAGAHALVLSLWSVEDSATAVLMRAFYTALLAGRSRADALRAAQCAMRDQHPFFWAAFQLAGDWRQVAWRHNKTIVQKEAVHV